MPFDAQGRFVDQIDPSVLASMAPAGAVAAPSELPLNPLAIDRSGVLDPNSPNSRPLVQAAGFDPPPGAIPPDLAPALSNALSLADGGGSSPAPAPAAAPAVTPPSVAGKPRPVAAPKPDPSVAAAADGVARAKANTEESIAANKELAAKTAEGEAAKAEEDAKHAKALEEQTSRFAQQRDAAHKETIAAQRRYEDMPLTTLMGSRTAAQHVLIAVGQLLGGVGFGANHVNSAVRRLEAAEHEFNTIQQQKNEKLFRAFQMQSNGEKDLDSRQLREAADLAQLSAARSAAIASKLRAGIASSKGRVDTAAATAELLKYERDAEANWQHATTARATAAHLDAETKEIPANARADRTLKYANAAVAGTLKLTEEERHVSESITGHLSKTDKITPKVKESVRLAEEALSGVRSGNPIEFKAALDAYTKAKTGLGARPQSVKVFEESMGGSLDVLEGHIQKAINGNSASKAMVKRFESALEHDIATQKKVLDSGRVATVNGLKRNPAYKTHADTVDAVVNQFYGFDPTAPEPKPVMVTIRNGKTGETKQVTEEEARKIGAIK